MLLKALFAADGLLLEEVEIGGQQTTDIDISGSYPVGGAICPKLYVHILIEGVFDGAGSLLRVESHVLDGQGQQLHIERVGHVVAAFPRLLVCALDLLNHPLIIFLELPHVRPHVK